MPVFHSEGSLGGGITNNLENHSLVYASDCILSISAATLYIWRSTPAVIWSPQYYRICHI